MKKFIPYIIAIAITSLLWCCWCRMTQCELCNDRELAQDVRSGSHLHSPFEIFQDDQGSV